MRRIYERCRSWLTMQRTPQLLLVAAVIQALAFAIDHQIRSFPDSRAYLQAAHAWFDPTAWVPIHRYQDDLFSIIWAPFVRSSHIGTILILEAIVLLLLADLVFYRGLLRLQVSQRAAWWAALAVSCLPPALYFERIALSESLSYDEVLVWVFLVAWAARPWRAWRVFVVAVYTLFIAETTRSAFLTFFVAVVAAVLVAWAVRAWRRRAVDWRRTAAGVAALALGAAAGMIGGSALQGAASHVPVMTALNNSSDISGFLLMAKYAALVPCDPPLDHVKQVICDSSESRMRTSDSADYVFWYTKMTPDWNDTSTQQFAAYGRDYKSEAISAILHSPLGAAKIAVRDGLHMLLPVQSFRYVSDPATLSAVSTMAPGLKLRSAASWPADDDIPYRASAATDVLRFFAVIALAVIAIVRVRRRRAGLGVVFLGIWGFAFLALAVFAYPTERYLMPLDPLLVVGAVLMFAGHERGTGDVIDG